MTLEERVEKLEAMVIRLTNQVLVNTEDIVLLEEGITEDINKTKNDYQRIVDVIEKIKQRNNKDS